ncbi:MAG: membrane protein insertase YidC, partial [Sphingomonas sp.]|nr:membrane protein insertase YidC [Sphingomonas sp.]
MKNDNRNFMMFAVLAVLLLFAWPLVMNKIMPPANPPVTKIEGGKTQVQPNPSTPTSANPAAIRNLNQVLKETAGQRIAIDTPTLKGSINLKGGRIDDLLLARYKETIDKNSPPIRLFSPAGTTDAYFGEFGWTGDGVTTPGPDTVFSTKDTVLAPGRPVTLDWANPAGLHFRIRIAIDDNYMFTVDQLVGNATSQPVTLRPYALISRAGVSKDAQSNNHIGPIGFFCRIWNGNAQPGANYFDNTGGWLGFGDKYWLAALIPAQATAVHSGFPAKTNDHYQADVTPAKPITVAAGRGKGTRTLFFAGAKEVNLLDRYEDQLKIEHFGRAIDWGWFEIIEKPIFKYLDWLFRSIGNFGVAIMLLTVTIRLLIFPIAQRQFASMAQMRAIQPKMKALQEKHKDDKQR